MKPPDSKDPGGVLESLDAASAKKQRPKLVEHTEASKPVIRIRNGELHLNANAAESALIAAGVPIYQRGSALVRPAVREVPASDGRSTISAALSEVKVASLLDVLSDVADWQKFDARGKGWMKANPPKLVADILLSRFGLWKSPTIVGLLTTPTMRADGTILSADGYDPATRLFHIADPELKLHSAVDKPTRADAKGAVELLVDLLGGFPFVDNISRAVALSAIITPVVRGAAPSAPMHLFRAPTPGSGKSYLADVAAAIATGRICPVASAAEDPGETEKRLVGLLLAGFPIISLDNCNGEIGGDLLCQAVERQLILVRPLGSSTMIEIESRATIFANGNQARVSGDMVRRTLVCDLDAEVERPEERKFAFDPVSRVMEDRSLYVSACLIIVRAYRAAGCPKQNLAPLQSFGAWSTAVRSALVWLGMADPAESIMQGRDDDPVLSDMKEMMTAWDGAFGSLPTTIRDAMEAATAQKVQADENGDVSYSRPTTVPAYPELRDVFLRLAGIRGVIEAKKIGEWLRNHGKRPVAGCRFVKDGTSHGVARWKLERLR